MMTRAEVRQKLVKLVADEANMAESEIRDDSRFKEDLAFDSLSAVEIVINTEGAFDVSIPDEEAEKLVMVKDLLDCVCQKLDIRE